MLLRKGIIKLFGWGKGSLVFLVAKILAPRPHSTGGAKVHFFEKIMKLYTYSTFQTQKGGKNEATPAGFEPFCYD
jgi:hypothetical protein